MSKFAVAVFIGFCSVCSSAWAQIENFAPMTNLEENATGVLLHVDGKHTDNAQRTRDGKVDDTLASVGLAGNYSRVGTRLDVAARGDLDWVKYLDNTYGSQLYGYADGSAVWGKAADFFQYLVRDNYGQARNDAFAAPTPDTVESVNNFQTGPAFNLRFGARTRLTVFGLYSNTNYEDSPFDSDGITGGASLVRAISETGRISLNGVTQSVDYDDPTAATDYDTRSAYFRYQNAGARTSLAADVGYNQLRQAGDTFGGALVRIGVQRRVSASSLMRLDLEQSFSSTGDIVGRNRNIGTGTNTPDALATADPFKGRSAQLGWSTVLPRTDFLVNAFWRDEKYQTLSTLDRSVQGLDVSVTRRLRPSLSLLLKGTYEAERYDVLDADSDNITLIAELQSYFGRRLGAALRYERYRRTGAQSSFEYTENRIGVRVTYQILGQR